MLCRRRSIAARCSFPRPCSLLCAPLRTFATRRPTKDARSHGKEHSDAERDAGYNNDTNTVGGWPHPIHASARTEAKKSIFVAHASRLPSASPILLRAFLDHLTAQPALKRATHCMYAWRVVPQAGSDTNSNTNTSTALTGQNDGGENGAGERLARLLEATGCANVVVVVSRWYGGVNLGSERWKMISGVAKDALAQGAFRGDNNGSVDSRSSTSEAANTKVASTNKKKRKKRP